jgi:hypothetical protein
MQVIKTSLNIPAGTPDMLPRELLLAARPLTVCSTLSWKNCTAIVIFDAWSTCKKNGVSSANGILKKVVGVDHFNSASK